MERKSMNYPTFSIHRVFPKCTYRMLIFLKSHKCKKIMLTTHVLTIFLCDNSKHSTRFLLGVPLFVWNNWSDQHSIFCYAVSIWRRRLWQQQHRGLRLLLPYDEITLWFPRLRVLRKKKGTAKMANHPSKPIWLRAWKYGVNRQLSLILTPKA